MHIVYAKCCGSVRLTKKCSKNQF